jgi:hypothetical protein
MNMPGFVALETASKRYRPGRASDVSAVRGKVVPQRGFGPTLPSCHYEKQWVVCGSPLPGYPAPMCLEWVYVCTFPGSSRTMY